MGYIYNNLSDVLVMGTSDDDSIYNGGLKATIDSGDGNDTVQNGNPNFSGKNALINSGAGNDSISNSKEEVTIDAGAGADIVNNSGIKSLIYAGEDNDFITNGGENVSLYAQGGNDTVRNYGSNSFISGGKGNDSISLIYSQYNSISYASGDGIDTILGFDETDTLNISGGSYSTAKSGNDLIVTVGTGKIILIGAADLSSINIVGSNSGTKNTDINFTDRIKISGTKNKDSLRNYGDKVTISSGKGDDTIRNYGDKVKIFGDAGKDSIRNYGDNVTVSGGAGNDVFIYKPNEGTDTIFDYESGDMLKILKSNGKDGGTFTDSTFKNNKLTLAIDGGGKVIFDGVSSGDQININGTSYTISGKKLK